MSNYNAPYPNGGQANNGPATGRFDRSMAGQGNPSRYNHNQSPNGAQNLQKGRGRRNRNRQRNKNRSRDQPLPMNLTPQNNYNNSNNSNTHNFRPPNHRRSNGIQKAHQAPRAPARTQGLDRDQDTTMTGTPSYLTFIQWRENQKSLYENGIQEEHRNREFQEPQQQQSQQQRQIQDLEQQVRQLQAKQEAMQMVWDQRYHSIAPDVEMTEAPPLAVSKPPPKVGASKTPPASVVKAPHPLSAHGISTI